MTPPPDTRERLLRAGQRLAAKRGLRALTVRAVATAAKANLGSFVHHFGTRDAFAAELLERWYAPLFARLEPLAQASGDPLAQLRAVLLQLAAWLAAHGRFVAQLLADAAAGEAAAAAFVRSLEQRHPALVLRLLAQAQAAGRVERADPLQQMLFLMAAVAGPVLTGHLLAGRELAPAALAQALAAAAQDEALLAERVDWALRGLARPQAAR